VTDGQKDRRIHDDGKYRASIASRGKKHYTKSRIRFTSVQRMDVTLKQWRNGGAEGAAAPGAAAQGRKTA